MAEPFLAEIKIVGFNFAPRGWAFCDGQILPINQNQSLYSLLGTTYGGDGRTTFALPELRGRTPIHEGQDTGANHPLGEKTGQETVTLTAAETPAHTHAFRTSNTEATLQRADPQNQNSVLGTATIDMYRSDGNARQLNAASVSSVGGNQAHNNMMPYLALNFCLALQGLFPSRN